MNENKGKVSVLLVRTGEYPITIQVENSLERMKELLGGRLCVKSLSEDGVLVKRADPETTVEDFLKRHPNATVDMMTPGGYVNLSPEQAKTLLEGCPVFGHLGVSETNHTIYPDELLPQGVASIKQDKSTNDHFSLMTDAALPLNRTLVNTYTHKEFIAGDFIIAYERNGEFADLPKDMAEKYTQKFRYPERFYEGREGLISKRYAPDGSGIKQQDERDTAR